MGLGPKINGVGTKIMDQKGRHIFGPPFWSAFWAAFLFHAFFWATFVGAIFGSTSKPGPRTCQEPAKTLNICKKHKHRGTTTSNNTRTLHTSKIKRPGHPFARRSGGVWGYWGLLGGLGGYGGHGGYGGVWGVGYSGLFCSRFNGFGIGRVGFLMTWQSFGSDFY